MTISTPERTPFHIAMLLQLLQELESETDHSRTTFARWFESEELKSKRHAVFDLKYALTMASSDELHNRPWESASTALARSANVLAHSSLFRSFMDTFLSRFSQSLTSRSIYMAANQHLRQNSDKFGAEYRPCMQELLSTTYRITEGIRTWNLEEFWRNWVHFEKCLGSAVVSFETSEKYDLVAAILFCHCCALDIVDEAINLLPVSAQYGLEMLNFQSHSYPIHEHPIIRGNTALMYSLMCSDTTCQTPEDMIGALLLGFSDMVDSEAARIVFCGSDQLDALYRTFLEQDFERTVESPHRAANESLVDVLSDALHQGSQSGVRLFGSRTSFQRESELSQYMRGIETEYGLFSSLVSAKVYLQLLTPLYTLALGTKPNSYFPFLLEDLIVDIAKLASSYNKIDREEFHLFNGLLKATWPSSRAIMFTHGLALFDIARNVRPSLNPNELGHFLRTHIGAAGEYYVERLSGREIFRVCHNLLTSLQGNPNIDHISAWYRRCGLVLDKDQNPFSVTLDGSVHVDPKFEESEDRSRWYPEGSSKGWERWFNAYKVARTSSDWIHLEAEVALVAGQFCQKLSHEQSFRIANELETRWYNDFRRVLIARRILVGAAQIVKDENTRLCLLGWADPIDIARGYMLDKGGYYQYLFKCGLTAKCIRDPIGSKCLFPEEINWLSGLMSDYR